MTVDNWFNALGQPVPVEGWKAAHELLISEGLHPGNAALTLDVVAREIEHDNPERAVRYMRSLCGPFGAETLVLRALATMCAVA